MQASADWLISDRFKCNGIHRASDQAGRYAPDDDHQDSKPAPRFRLLLCSYLLLGITLAIYSRTVLAFAAVEMVASNVANKELLQLLAGQPRPATGANQTDDSRLLLSARFDGSCPIRAGSHLLDPVDSAQAFKYNTTFARQQAESRVRESVGRRLVAGDLVDWTPGEQGAIFAAGSLGNLLLAIPLSRLGELYGSKWIIFGALTGASLQAGLMPLVAPRGVLTVTVFQFVFNGLAFGADCVAYTLYANWLTPVEMAFFVACLLVCYQLGGIVSGASISYMLAHQIHWQWCFYTTGNLKIYLLLFCKKH